VKAAVPAVELGSVSIDFYRKASVFFLSAEMAAFGANRPLFPVFVLHTNSKFR
jgi:hypothetical protein